MKRIAPEMTPVSKPKRRPANAAVPATIFTKGPVGFAPENLVVCVIDSISQLVVRNYSVLFLRGGRRSAVVVNDDPRTPLITDKGPNPLNKNTHSQALLGQELEMDSGPGQKS